MAIHPDPLPNSEGNIVAPMVVWVQPVSRSTSAPYLYLQTPTHKRGFVLNAHTLKVNIKKPFE
jgi:hypothetical protein